MPVHPGSGGAGPGGAHNPAQQKGQIMEVFEALQKGLKRRGGGPTFAQGATGASNISGVDPVGARDPKRRGSTRVKTPRGTSRVSRRQLGGQSGPTAMRDRTGTTGASVKAARGGPKSTAKPGKPKKKLAKAGKSMTEEDPAFTPEYGKPPPKPEEMAAQAAAGAGAPGGAARRPAPPQPATPPAGITAHQGVPMPGVNRRSVGPESMMAQRLPNTRRLLG